MKFYAAVLAVLMVGMLVGVGYSQNALAPGQSMTVMRSFAEPSRKLTKEQMATVRQVPMKKATKDQCDPFPCRMGEFTTYICSGGYALLNQWHGIIASSIPDGTATVADIWDEDKAVQKCQNLKDWKFVLSVIGHDGRGLETITLPVPKELR